MNSWPTRKQKISKIIIHQSLSSGSLESIKAYHMSAANHITPGEPLPGVAYHYVVKWSGEVVQTAKDDEITWHCKGANSESLGVCVLGDFVASGYVGKASSPTPQQLAALSNLLRSLVSKYRIPAGSVLPHSAYGKPACPGFALEAFITGFNGGFGAKT